MFTISAGQKPSLLEEALSGRADLLGGSSSSAAVLPRCTRDRATRGVKWRDASARGGEGKKEDTRCARRPGERDWRDKVSPDFGPVRRPVEMLKQLQMGMRAFLLMASRVWTCICFLLKKQVRAVSRCFAPSSGAGTCHREYAALVYESFPLAPLLFFQRYRYVDFVMDATLARVIMTITRVSGIIS